MSQSSSEIAGGSSYKASSTKNASKGSSRASSWIPDPIVKFTAKFPLVVLPEEEDEGTKKLKEWNGPELWIQPPSSASDIDGSPSSSVRRYSWASPHPTSLRYQLLAIFRDEALQRIKFRPWLSPASMSVPGGVLPVLRLPIDSEETQTSGKNVLPTPEVRGWIDREFPLPDNVKELNGMPSQEAHTKALAVTQLILQSIYPAFAAVTSPRSTKLHLPPPFYEPIELSPAIYSSLPYALRNIMGAETRGARDREQKERAGVDALGALKEMTSRHFNAASGKWFLGAENPSPLDALIASHIYPYLMLDEHAVLRQSAEQHQEILSYVAKVMDFADERYRSRPGL